MKKRRTSIVLDQTVRVHSIDVGSAVRQSTDSSIILNMICRTLKIVSGMIKDLARALGKTGLIEGRDVLIWRQNLARRRQVLVLGLLEGVCTGVVTELIEKGGRLVI